MIQGRKNRLKIINLRFFNHSYIIDSVLNVLSFPAPYFPDDSDGKESACDVGDLGSLGPEILLEESVATHSSILSWRIPWTREPGGLQSTGLQKVRDD